MPAFGAGDTSSNLVGGIPSVIRAIYVPYVKFFFIEFILEIIEHLIMPFFLKKWVWEE